MTNRSRSARSAKAREWDLWPGWDGEPFTDSAGYTVLGWHPRSEGDDLAPLLAEFEAYHGAPLALRPILMREASPIEQRVDLRSAEVELEEIERQMAQRDYDRSKADPYDEAWGDDR